MSIEECEKLIATYEPSPEGRENFMLSVDGEKNNQNQISF